MGEDDYVPKTIPGLDYHTASYWVQVLQIPVYVLALIFLVRTVMFGRGFWHAASVAANKAG